MYLPCAGTGKRNLPSGVERTNFSSTESFALSKAMVAFESCLFSEVSLTVPVSSMFWATAEKAKNNNASSSLAFIIVGVLVQGRCKNAFAPTKVYD